MKHCLTCGKRLIPRQERPHPGICAHCETDLKFSIQMTCPICGDSVEGKPAPFNQIDMSCGHRLILCQGIAWIPSEITTSLL